MVLPLLLFVLLLGPLLWALVVGKDLWPFSHYPMFSRSMTVSEVAVFRLALETPTGQVVWWRSEFYRYPEFVGRTLKRIHETESNGGKSGALAALERRRCLNEVLRLIEAEGRHPAHYQAFHIVRRKVVLGDSRRFVIGDQLMLRIPLGGIKRFGRAG